MMTARERQGLKGLVRLLVEEFRTTHGLSRHSWLFDRAGRVLEEKWLTPLRETGAIRYRYDDEGNLVEPVKQERKIEMHPDGSRTVIELLPVMEELNWKVAPELPDITCPTRGASRVETSYDPRGFLTETVFYDEAGAVTTRVEFKTDARGNVTEVIRFSGTKTLLPRFVQAGMTEADRQKFRAFIEPGSVEWRTAFRYDDRGRVTERADYVASDIFSSRHTYTYNEHGDVATETTEDPKHGTSTARIEYDYDAHGNWIRKVVYYSGGSHETLRKITYYEE